MRPKKRGRETQGCSEYNLGDLMTETPWAAAVPSRSPQFGVRRMGIYILVRTKVPSSKAVYLIYFNLI
jgi:hypothetical protein